MPLADALARAQRRTAQSRRGGKTAQSGLVAVSPAPPAAGPWRSYKEIVAQLAGRIVEAQRPIRVLQALRWDNSVEEQFFKSRPRELPQGRRRVLRRRSTSASTRAPRPKSSRRSRATSTASSARRDAIGHIMMTTALEYRDVVRMLAARGTPNFYA